MMRIKALTTGIVAIVLAAMPLAVSEAASTSGSEGLWPGNFQATATDCEVGTRDGNNFCSYDDNRSVELGVKFTTSKEVLVSGVRVYRVDSGSVTGSLWTADGTLLATGSFAPYSGEHGWQDLVFDSPVAVVPGQTYIASYYTPNAHYAYQYYFFASSLTVGPITARQSVEGDRNGVYCYVGDPCGPLPTESYRDSNYWVTPLWSYDFRGFYQPVENAPAWNAAKAGSAIPVKFSLGGDLGLEILNTGFPKVSLANCPNASVAMDTVEETVAASNSGLTYDATADQYVYVWKTNKSWVGTCRQLELGLNDGSSHIIKVQFN